MHLHPQLAFLILVMVGCLCFCDGGVWGQTTGERASFPTPLVIADLDSDAINTRVPREERTVTVMSLDPAMRWATSVCRARNAVLLVNEGRSAPRGWNDRVDVIVPEGSIMCSQVNLTIVLQFDPFYRVDPSGDVITIQLTPEIVLGSTAGALPFNGTLRFAISPAFVYQSVVHARVMRGAYYLAALFSIVGGALGHPALTTHVPRANFLFATSVCNFKRDFTVDIVQYPLQIGIGNTPERYFVGATSLNLLLIAALLVAHLGFLLWQTKVQQHVTSAVRSVARSATAAASSGSGTAADLLGRIAALRGQKGKDEGKDEGKDGHDKAPAVGKNEMAAESRATPGGLPGEEQGNEGGKGRADTAGFAGDGSSAVEQSNKAQQQEQQQEQQQPHEVKEKEKEKEMVTVKIDGDGGKQSGEVLGEVEQPDPQTTTHSFRDAVRKSSIPKRQLFVTFMLIQSSTRCGVAVAIHSESLAAKISLALLTIPWLALLGLLAYLLTSFFPMHFDKEKMTEWRRSRLDRMLEGVGRWVVAPPDEKTLRQRRTEFDVHLASVAAAKRAAALAAREQRRRERRERKRLPGQRESSAAAAAASEGEMPLLSVASMSSSSSSDLTDAGQESASGGHPTVSFAVGEGGSGATTAAEPHKVAVGARGGDVGTVTPTAAAVAAGVPISTLSDAAEICEEGRDETNEANGSFFSNSIGSSDALTAEDVRELEREEARQLRRERRHAEVDRLQGFVDRLKSEGKPPPEDVLKKLHELLLPFDSDEDIDEVLARADEGADQRVWLDAETFHRHFAPLYDRYTRGRHWFILVEIGVSLAYGFLEGLRLDGGCVPVASGALGVGVLYLLCLAWLRPFVAPVDSLCFGVGAVLAAVVPVFQLVFHLEGFPDSHRWAEGVASVLVVVWLYFAIVRTTLILWSVRRRRNGSPQAQSPDPPSPDSAAAGDARLWVPRLQRPNASSSRFLLFEAPRRRHERSRILEAARAGHLGPHRYDAHRGILRLDDVTDASVVDAVLRGEQRYQPGRGWFSIAQEKEEEKKVEQEVLGGAAELGSEREEEHQRGDGGAFPLLSAAASNPLEAAAEGVEDSFSSSSFVVSFAFTSSSSSSSSSASSAAVSSHTSSSSSSSSSLSAEDDDYVCSGRRANEVAGAAPPHPPDPRAAAVTSTTITTTTTTAFASCVPVRQLNEDVYPRAACAVM